MGRRVEANTIDATGAPERDARYLLIHIMDQFHRSVHIFKYSCGKGIKKHDILKNNIAIVVHDLQSAVQLVQLVFS